MGSILTRNVVHFHSVYFLSAFSVFFLYFNVRFHKGKCLYYNIFSYKYITMYMNLCICMQAILLRFKYRWNLFSNPRWKIKLKLVRTYNVVPSKFTWVIQCGSVKGRPTYGNIAVRNRKTLRFDRSCHISEMLIIFIYKIKI